MTEPGASTIEHLLPLMLHLVNRNEIKLNRALSLLTSEPAKILGVSKGTIENNKNADLCVYDPNKNLSIDKNNLFSSYDAYLRKRYKIKVNYKALDKVNNYFK